MRRLRLVRLLLLALLLPFIVVVALTLRHPNLGRVDSMRSVPGEVAEKIEFVDLLKGVRQLKFVADFGEADENGEFRFENIWLDGKRENLFSLVRRLDPTDTKLMGLLETETLRTLREALSLYLVLFDLVAERSGYAAMLEQTDRRDEAAFRRLRSFLTTWSLFAASSYLVAKLGPRLDGSDGRASLQFEPDLFEAVFSGTTDTQSLIQLVKRIAASQSPERRGEASLPIPDSK